MEVGEHPPPPTIPAPEVSQYLHFSHGSCSTSTSRWLCCSFWLMAHPSCKQRLSLPLAACCASGFPLRVAGHAEGVPGGTGVVGGAARGLAGAGRAGDGSHAHHAAAPGGAPGVGGGGRVPRVSRGAAGPQRAPDLRQAGGAGRPLPQQGTAALPQGGPTSRRYWTLS